MKISSILSILILSISVCAVGHDGPEKGRAETKPGSSKTTVVATGTLQPTEIADVGVQVGGRIQKVLADYGAVVAAGDVLAQLETAPYEAEVARAKASVQRAEGKLRMADAQVSLAEYELQRASKLVAAKAGDSSELNAAKAKVDIAKAAIYVQRAGLEESKAALQRAQIDLGYCTILSPIEGVVIDRRCSLGQRVSPGPNAASLFVIARDLKKMQVWASVREADIARVAAGQTAEFTVEAYPKQTFQGRVAQVRLNAARRQGSVTYTVTIDVDNPDKRLLPAMTAQVSIAAGERQ
jgi:HlyD family secretion protein